MPQIFTNIYERYSNDDADKKDVFNIDKTMGRDVRFQMDIVLDLANNEFDPIDKFELTGPGCPSGPCEYTLPKPGLSFFEFQEDQLAVRRDEMKLYTKAAITSLMLLVWKVQPGPCD